MLQTRSDKELTLENAIKLFRKFQQLEVIEDAQNVRNKVPLEHAESSRLFRFVCAYSRDNSSLNGSSSLNGKSSFNGTSTLNGKSSLKGNSQLNVNEKENAERKVVQADSENQLTDAESAKQTVSNVLCEKRQFGNVKVDSPLRNCANSPIRNAVDSPICDADAPLRNTVLQRVRDALRHTESAHVAFTAFENNIRSAYIRHNCTHTTRCGLVTDLPREALYPDWLLNAMRILTVRREGRTTRAYLVY